MAKWDKTDKPWERQKGESAQAYQAFDCYLNQGDGRSLRRVAQELSKSDTLIKRWSSRWSWQERVRLYTNELRRQEFSAEQKAIKQMRQRQAKIAELMQEKGFKALRQLDPSKERIFTKDIIRMIEVGMKLEVETRQQIEADAAGQLGMNGGTDTLADTIIAAYAKRMEEDDD